MYTGPQIYHQDDYTIKMMREASLGGFFLQFIEPALDMNEYYDIVENKENANKNDTDANKRENV